MRISDGSSDVCSSDLHSSNTDQKCPRRSISRSDTTIRPGLRCGLASEGLTAIDLTSADLTSGDTAWSDPPGRLTQPYFLGCRKFVPASVPDRRSEDRRVGNAWGSTCRSRWAPY